MVNVIIKLLKRVAPLSTGEGLGVRLIAFILVFAFSSNAQETPANPYGQISGDVQINANFFQRDSSIGASGNPLYNNLLSSAESWLNLAYSNTAFGFDAGLRFDLYNNSNLINPSTAYTDQGIGFWYLRKNIKQLTITGGYFYDQFGSGIIYRSYEDRGLGIDYATLGIKLEYKFNDNWKAKAFTGRQKNLFSQYKPIIKGAGIEGYVKVNDNVSFAPGVAFLNRTMDASSVNFLINNISLQDSVNRFPPKYNVYAFTIFNTFNWKNFSWYIEAAGKTKEASYNNEGILVNKAGNVIYTSLTYSVKGFGITVQGKRTDNFDLRTSPNERLLSGVLDFLPPLTRQNTQRLLSRYIAATQTIGELAGEGDIIFTPVDGYTVSLNYSNVHNLDKTQLYQEIFGELEINKWSKIKLAGGAQYVLFNQAIYRVEPGRPNVKAVTPFAEATYKITRKRSVRMEVQYQSTKQDYGSWAFALLEYNIAPRFSFSVSDMYNIRPNPDVTIKKNHYYNVFASYTHNATRFSISYVKQVEGYNCTGGVCRYEPAFSGVRVGITSTF